MKVRKKPVVVEAMQYYGRANEMDILKFCRDRATISQGGAFDRDRLIIATLEGSLEAQPGDWIIQGVQDELYPVKPDIFHATYEFVE